MTSDDDDDGDNNDDGGTETNSIDQGYKRIFTVSRVTFNRYIIIVIVPPYGFIVTCDNIVVVMFREHYYVDNFQNMDVDDFFFLSDTSFGHNDYIVNVILLRLK